MDAETDNFPGQVDVLEFTLEHVTAIASPARSEVFWAFNATEPRSVLDVARQMRKPAATVHYHVNELARVGLLLPVASRKRHARTERLYVLAGRAVVSKPHPRSDEYRQQASKGFGAILRIFSRERAVLNRVLPVRPDLSDFCTFRLYTMRLKPEDGQQLKAELAALLDKYRAREVPDGVRVRVAAISHPDMGELRAAYLEATGSDLRAEKETENP